MRRGFRCAGRGWFRCWRRASLSEKLRFKAHSGEQRTQTSTSPFLHLRLLFRTHEARQSAAHCRHECRYEFGRFVQPVAIRHISVCRRRGVIQMQEPRHCRQVWQPCEQATGTISLPTLGNLFLLLFLAARFWLQEARAAYFRCLGGGSAARPCCRCRSASRRSSSTCSSNRAARAASSA